MRRSLLLLLLFACSRDPVTTSAPRPAEPAVWAVATQTGLHVPNPNCTCASPESFPAPSKYESECDEPLAMCGYVHYTEFLARTAGLKGRDRLGTLLTTHYVEPIVYDATITFAPINSGSYANHDSTMRVHIGDVIPTPHGHARVVQVYRSFVEDDDDGRVRLHYLERFASDEPWMLFVSSGAPSHIDGQAVTLIRASGGEADIAWNTPASAGGDRIEHLKKGDTVKTAAGDFPVTEIVDGRIPGDLGWVAIDTHLKR